jgi:2-methylcitrate dehydratase
MTEVQQLAAFVDRVQVGDLSERALEQIKIRVLDTIGVANRRPDGESNCRHRGT